VEFICKRSKAAEAKQTLWSERRDIGAAEKLQKMGKQKSYLKRKNSGHILIMYMRFYTNHVNLATKIESKVCWEHRVSWFVTNDHDVVATFVVLV